MNNTYIELRVKRDFGAIITTYFDFFKQNFKKFTNIFIRYNGIFLLFFLLISYLMVSGFLGLSNQFGLPENDLTQNRNYAFYLGLGILLFLGVIMIVASLNFSISSIYMSRYEKNEGAHFDKKEVWEHIKKRFGSIVGFIVLLIPIYGLFLIVSLVLGFIPLLGIFIQYGIQLGLNAWIGVSFMSMIYEEKGVIDAFGEGWRLVLKNFWKSIGINLIMALLIMVLLFVVLIIPTIIISVYTFHAVDTNVAISESVVAKLVYTLGTCCLLIVIAYSQCLSQFVNGILYFNLHEQSYNNNLRSKIDRIGQHHD